MNYFAHNLKYIIARFGIKQTDIAFHINKKQTTISNWIREISEPDVSDLLLLYQLFDISIDTLIGVDMEKEGSITDEDVDFFMKNGKLQGRVRKTTASGNRTDKDYPVYNDPRSVVSESGFGLEAWAIMGQLRILQDKLDIVINKVNPPTDDPNEKTS